MKDKNKIVTIILAVVCVVSIIGVAYLYTANSSLKSENANLQSELENTQNQINELQDKITELEATIESLKIAKANIEIAQTVESTKESTEDSTATEGESGVTVNSTHDDVQLGDDEYKGNNELDGAYESLSDEEKAEVDQILEELLEEHPEWLEDNGDNRADNYLEVDGVVDTGEVTDPGLSDRIKNDDGSEAAGAIVY